MNTVVTVVLYVAVVLNVLSAVLNLLAIRQNRNARRTYDTLIRREFVRMQDADPRNFQTLVIEDHDDLREHFEERRKRENDRRSDSH